MVANLARFTHLSLRPLRICTPYTFRVAFHLPATGSLPHLLHGDIVLTRLGTCNLFVPRPDPVARELRSTAIPCRALSHSRSSLGFPAALAKSALLVRNGALSLHACISIAHHHCRPTLWSAIPAWNNFLFFPPFFLKNSQTRHTVCTCYESLDTPPAELRIKLRFSLDAASLVSLHHRAISLRTEKIQKNMYVVIRTS